MPGSNFGTLFHISTFGESHGPALGVVIDGCPAGLALTEEDIIPYMNRRRPGQSQYTTARSESDTPEILSGTFNGVTTGAPIAILIRNTDHRSKDYSEIADIFRPGHADFTFFEKYGIRDYRGGGRSSARETAARVAAGAVAAKLLREFNIEAIAFTKSISDITVDDKFLDPMENRVRRDDVLKSPVFMPDSAAGERACAFLDKKREELDSTGGVVRIHVTGLPAGLGDTVFEKLDARLAGALMSIGAVKGVTIGDGFSVSLSTGSLDNDSFYADDDLNIHTTSNHGGGILGGMSTGGMIIAEAAFKPTPSIAKEQETVDKAGISRKISIKGRHDPTVVPRAVVVCECMVNLVIADALLTNATARLDNLHKIYRR